MKTDIFIAGVIVLIALLILGFHLSTGNEEFSRYNTGWNGTSDFFSLPDPHHTSDISRLSDLNGLQNAILLVIAPATSYPDSDLEEIRSFVESGNTLFIADDSGIGNPILQGIGSRIVIQPGVLGSIDRAYNDSYVVVTIPSSDHPLVDNLSTLVIDKGVTLTGGEPLVQSSIMSWVDTDGNRRVSGEESFGKRNVLSRESIGAGEVIVLADPGVFINSMLNVGDQWGNRQFIGRLISYRPTLCIEQVSSMTVVPEGPGRIVYLLRTYRDLKLVVVLLSLLIPCFLVFRVRPGKSGEEISDMINPEMPGGPTSGIPGTDKQALSFHPERRGGEGSDMYEDNNDR